MKVLENKVVELPAYAKKQGDKVDYARLIEFALDVQPQGGFLPSDLRTRSKIMDVIEASDGAFKFEDQQAKDLKTIMENSRWPTRDKEITEMLDEIDDMKDYVSPVKED